MPTPHKHAEVIHAYADGAKVEVLGQDGQWRKCQFPDFDPEWNYRIQTDPAAAKWPQTMMSPDFLRKEYNADMGGSVDSAFIRVANVVIEHECSTGALVPAATVREIEAKARAEAGILVAREIQKSVRILGHHSDSELRGLVEEILAKEAE